MSPSQTGKHAVSGVATNHSVVSEPSFAERARSLMHLARVGSLSTLSRKQNGFPFGSVMPYALNEAGHPLFLMSTMAMHTQNLLADPRSSLLVSQPHPGGEPLGASRVTLLGNVQLVSEPEVAETRRIYLARYPNSRNWVDFEDFSFYHMNVVDVYYVGGFGVMGWVSASEYCSAQPDPLADVAADIIQHMNSDHADALILLVRAFAGIQAQEAVMTSVDRLGFQVRLMTTEGTHNMRLAFSREVSNPAEARGVLMDMVAKARHETDQKGGSSAP